MGSIAESVMLICFGISWPVSVVKSLRSGTAAGKSIVFMLAIITGYIAGIIGKFVKGDTGYVLVLYFINLFMVAFDTVLYFKNKSRDKKRESEKNAEARNAEKVYAA